MLIGVFSDVHDQLANLEKALSLYGERGIETLIFCGDFCSPIPARRMAAFTGVIHCVFGNGDGDPFTISQIAKENTNLKVHGPHAELDLDGARMAITHYPLYGQALARTGDYRAVFSGHTHVWHEERFGGCRWLNPGEILGWKGLATCAVYDTTSGVAERIEL